MKQGDGPQSLTALQHYQQAIPSLKERLNTSEDMLSDGAMLTHLMLLLYEVSWKSSLIKIISYLTLSDSSFRAKRIKPVVVPYGSTPPSCVVKK